MSVSMNHQLEITMKTTIKLALALAALSTAPAFAHDKHGHENYSAGEPGDPKKPARTVEVLLNEMDYTPAKIEVKRGEQIRFVLRNVGKEDHEFLLATTKENLAHADEMKKHPHMEHDDPNAVRLAPSKTAEILWKFSKPGTFEYSCLIPDHRDNGMIGHVTVK
ncbi:copper resistance protein [Bradyrhizobium vignae]|nr:copper resistance protein [Bradyrhizobium vignae]